MKISIIVLICVSSVLYVKTVEGQLDNLFGSVQKAASTVGKGLGGLLIPRRKETGDKKQDVGKADNDVKTSTISAATEVTPKADNTPASPKADTPASQATTPKVAGNGKPDDKDGRENFAGGCLPGYMRTGDGRCMPTF